MMTSYSNSFCYRIVSNGMVRFIYVLSIIVVCQRLLTSLDRLISKGTNEQTTLLLLSTLDLMQGLLLIHPPSRRLFVREIHMTVLLLPCCAV
jgi:Cell division control protein 14, SIN component